MQKPSRRRVCFAMPCPFPPPALTALLFGLAAVLLLAAGCAGSASGAGSAKTVTATGIAVRSAGCAQPAGPEQTESRQSIDVGAWRAGTSSAPRRRPRRARCALRRIAGGEAPRARLPRPRRGCHPPRDDLGFRDPRAEGRLRCGLPERHGDPSAVGHGRRACDQSRSRVRASPARPDRIDHVHRHLTVYASGFSDGSFMVSLLACTMSVASPPSGLCRACSYRLRAPPPGGSPSSRSTGPPTRSCSSTGVSAPPRSAACSGKARRRPPGDHNHHRLGQPQWCGHPGDRPRLAKKDGCDGRATNTRLDSQVVQRTYRCPPGAGVVFYIILGGGHAWPGSASAGRSAPSPASPPSRWTPPRPCGRSSSASRSERAQETSPAVVTFSPSAARER